MSGDVEPDDEPSGPAHLDPAVVLLPGRADPAALLCVWLLRKSFWAFLWFGLASVVWVSGSDGYQAQELDTWGERVRALASPLAGLLVAVGVRVLAAGLGFVLAVRVARGVELVRRSAGAGRWGMIAVLSDQLHLTRAYRALRWTTAVRDEATARLGEVGGRFVLAERILSVATVVLAVGTVAVALLP